MIKQELIIKADEEGDEMMGGKGLRERFAKWLNIRVKGRLSRGAALFRFGSDVH